MASEVRKERIAAIDLSVNYLREIAYVWAFKKL